MKNGRREKHLFSSVATNVSIMFNLASKNTQRETTANLVKFTAVLNGIREKNVLLTRLSLRIVETTKDKLTL